MEFGTVYEAFVSEFVEVYTSSPISASEETAEGIYKVSECMVVKGFLVDMDEERLYLGPAPDVIKEWVSLASVWRVKIVEEEDPATEALKAFPIPKNDDEVN